MNFLKGPKQFTPLLHTLISVSDKGFIAVTGFIMPIYQQRLNTISLLLAAFGQVLFSIVFKAGK